ncbi:TrmH family RNA methyltransferase [Mycoplasmopsis edwardii]|uniref:RNA methyltransferase n=1 Tax=Mycoplasmopsis edwardii TaxID=53558 RepID=A0ACD4PH30_9BACT|nr:RNA methyltransferase [Mycoplasmopsis edwardii]WBP83972.1 RNA methyltransferase [Mycoplasmopsis edwardii]
MIITSKQNPIIKNLKKLQDKKYRNLEQKFLVSGFHLVNEALENGIVSEIFESEDSNKYPNATKVSYNLIKYLSETETPQKVIAVCDKTKVKHSKINKVIALNNLQDPGNVGTIIRLAKAFAFDTVIVENLDPYNDKVIRSSQGAIFKLNVIETKDLKQNLIKLKNDGFKVFETLLDKNASKLNDVQFPNEKLVIVVGNEGNGINDEIKKLSDLNIYIPIEFESLNVAVATGIVLDKVYNRR